MICYFYITLVHAGSNLGKWPPYTLLHAPPLLHRLEFHHEHWTNISIRVDEELSKKWRFWIFKLDEMHLVCMYVGLVCTIYFT